MSQPSPDHGGATYVRRGAESMEREFRVVYMVLRDPRAPWYCKAVAGCAVGYALSPITIIPDWLPVIGLLDNVLALIVGMWLVEKIAPRRVIIRCRSRALYDATRWQTEKRSGARKAIAAVVIAKVALALVFAGALLSWLGLI